jgi:SAM-dependent methyltransferase
MVRETSMAPREPRERFNVNLNSQFYENIATIYDSIYDDVDAEEAVRQWCLLVRECANLPRPNQDVLPRLLDLGCGTGKYLDPWAAAGFCVTGADASGGMISCARRRRRLSGLSSRIHLVHCDLREPNLSLNKAGPFDIAVAHFNFFNLLPPGDISMLLERLASCMTVEARLFTDCASPGLMPEKTRDRIVVADGAVVEVVTRPNPAAGTVTRSYRIHASQISERYWLHSTPTLRAAATQAGWRLERTYAWTPDCPQDPWHPIRNRRTAHRLCVFKLISSLARQPSR